MLGSDYRELIVLRRDTLSKKAALTVAGTGLTLLSIIVSVISGAYFLLLLSLLLGFGTWFLRVRNSIEYEYIISGDELSVTKILAESKRKPMMSVTFNRFTAFGKLSEAPDAGSRTLVLACEAQDDTAFYADFDHAEHGQTRLIWTPNEDILLYLTKHLPRTLHFQWTPQQNNEASTTTGTQA